MAKQILLLIILSVLVVLFAHPLAVALHGVAQGREWVSHYLSFIFAGDRLGFYLRQTITLIGISFIVALIVNTIYWLIKRQSLPILIHVMWFVWLVLVMTYR